MHTSRLKALKYKIFNQLASDNIDYVRLNGWLAMIDELDIIESELRDWRTRMGIALD